MRHEIETQVIDVLDKASRIWNRDFDIPAINLNLRGRAAGQYKYQLNRYTGEIRNTQFRFNKVLFEENREDFLNRTVPHEVAHHITRVMYGDVKPHGREWKGVMTTLGFDNSTYHTYDTTNSSVQRKRLRHLYHCVKCDNKMALTPQKHKQSYRFACGSCGCDIYSTGKVIDLNNITAGIQ